MPLVPIWNIFCLPEQRDLPKGQRVRFPCMGGKKESWFMSRRKSLKNLAKGEKTEWRKSWSPEVELFRGRACPCYCLQGITV